MMEKENRLKLLSLHYRNPLRLLDSLIPNPTTTVVVVYSLLLKIKLNHE